MYYSHDASIPNLMIGDKPWKKKPTKISLKHHENYENFLQIEYPAMDHFDIIYV